MTVASVLASISELKHSTDLLLPWHLTSYAPACFTFEKFLTRVAFLFASSVFWLTNTALSHFIAICTSRRFTPPLGPFDAVETLSGRLSTAIPSEPYALSRSGLRLVQPFSASSLSWLAWARPDVRGDKDQTRFGAVPI